MPAPPPGAAPAPPYGYAYGYPPYGQPPPYQRKLPDVLPYTEGQTVPPGYVLVERSHLDIAAIGGAIFLLGYLPSVYVGALGSAVSSSSTSSSDSDFAPLYIPVAGPFIAIDSTNASSSGAFWLVVLGVAQAAGAATAITGLAMPPEQLLYREDLALRVAPYVGNNGSGLAISGLF